MIYYNPELGIIAELMGDLLIINHRPEDHTFTDAIFFKSVKADWKYIGRL